jgi:hypothetical protein
MQDAELARNYILDRLIDEDREACERRFLFDPEFETLLLDEERTLLDDYVNERLSKEDAKAVLERIAQQPGNLYRLRFAEGLRRAALESISAQPLTTSPLRRWRNLSTWNRLTQHKFLWFGGLAGAGVAAMAIVFAISPQRHPQPASSGQTASTAVAPAPSSINAPAPQKGSHTAPERTGATHTTAASPSLPPSIATFALLAIEQRGAGEDTAIDLKPGISTLRLQLTTEEGLAAGRYAATVRDASGNHILSSPHMSPRSESGRLYIDLRIPTVQLAPGSYSIDLIREAAAPAPPLTYRFALAAHPRQ